MKAFHQCLAVAALVSLPWHLAAAAEEHREHDAHVHGAANLNIAIENDHIDAELETPAMNIVGFEHAPRDAEQREAVARAVALLEDGAARLVPSEEAGCRLDSASVESSLMDADHDQDHDHDEVHSEFHVIYRFHCESPDAIKAMQVNLFEEFPGMEEIELQVLTADRQIGGVLTPNENRVDLTR